MWCEGLEQEEWEEKHDHDNLIRYLHGECDEWVLENYKEGDKAVIWNEFNDELDKVCLIHCYIIRNQKYIDVRGETENIKDIEEGFDYYPDNSKIYCGSLEEYKRIIREICHYQYDRWK